jgi:dimethylaniline monooxygenase (N-oxide forming)
LKNSREQYTFSDFPWPQEPDQHPSAEQILNYLEGAVEHYGLDVRLEHCVTQMLEVEGGWTLTVEHDKATQVLRFDYVVISIGQYAERKYRPEFPGEAEFSGQVLPERDVKKTWKFLAIRKWQSSVLERAPSTCARLRPQQRVQSLMCSAPHDG